MRRRGGEEGGEGTDLIEHARVGRFQGAGHFAFGVICLVDIDTGAGIRKALLHRSFSFIRSGAG